MVCNENLVIFLYIPSLFIDFIDIHCNPHTVNDVKSFLFRIRMERTYLPSSHFTYMRKFPFQTNIPAVYDNCAFYFWFHTAFVGDR